MAPRGTNDAVTNAIPNNPTVIPLMPTFSGSDPRSKILNTTTAATSSAAPATSGHIGILLSRCTPPALAIDANGPSRTSLTAGPIIARIPETIPAAAPITIKPGVKCAAMAPPDPANIDRPNRSTK